MGKKQTRSSKNRAPKKKVTAPAFPRFETTDFDDPDTFAVWAFAGLPHMKGAPLGIPVPMLRWISRRLWDCGFRLHPELRTIKYRPPTTDLGLGMFTSAGEWVPIDDPDPDGPSPEVRAAIAGLPEGQKSELARSIMSSLGLDPEARQDDLSLTDRVPYVRADGSTVQVTPAQARRYANAKKARNEKGGRS